MNGARMGMAGVARCARRAWRAGRALAVVLAVPALAQAPTRRALAIEDYYRLKSIGSVALSPDAHWVAFTVSTRVEASNGTASEVWLAPFDGSMPARRVSREGVNAAIPWWRDDGRLVFTQDGQPATLDPTNPDSVEIGGTPAAGRGGGRGGRGGRGGGRGNAAGAEVQSPDGAWYFVVRDTPPPKPAPLPETDFEKRHRERFKGVEFDWLDFHRDGQPFPLPNAKDPQVNPPQEIFIAPSAGRNGGAEQQVTALGLRPTGVQWGADSRTIYFTADSLYRAERSYGCSQVWAVTLDGARGTVRRISPSTDYDYENARLSPDGKWILATRQLTTDYVIAHKLNHGGATDLVLIPTAGGAERNLTAVWDYLPGGAQWSQDSKFMYFTGGVGGTVHVFRVAAAGGPVEQVTTGERRIGDLQLDLAHGRMVYTVNTFDAPAELWSANLDGSGERQLTHVFDDFTREVALSEARRIRFRSADGWPVEGWLTLPYGYRSGGAPFPLIVSNHGGPHSAIQYGLNFKNQYFAANGYAVLEVNFRSSTGYGEKHLWGTWGAWGTKDGQDVMAGVDYALAHFNLDPKRVASIGHSYGGFLTNWLITQYPARFAAAASGAGIVNWTSDYGNADIPRTKETEFFGAPWNPKAREIMIRQSPLTYADRATAPTLFINGEIDQRVPFSENEQLFVALKKNGVPAKMIRYDGMPHAISGNWNIVHRMLNERAWFDRWLKGGVVP